MSLQKLNHSLVHADLAEKLTRIDHLTRLLEKITAMPLTNRVWPVLKSRRLLLLTDDPHFATQARFMQKDIRKQISGTLNIKLVALDIKLIALPLASFGRKTGRLPISLQTSSVIHSIANEINDAELRQTLQNVANAACSQQ